MEAIKALKHLKQTRNKKLHFFFCGVSRADKKPLLVFEEHVVPADQGKVLAASGSEANSCHGDMVLDVAGNLNIKTKGKVPAKLVSSVKKYAKKSELTLNAIFLNGVQLTDTADEDEGPGTEQPANSIVESSYSAVPPAPPEAPPSGAPAGSLPGAPAGSPPGAPAAVTPPAPKKVPTRSQASTELVDVVNGSLLDSIYNPGIARQLQALAARTYPEDPEDKKLVELHHSRTACETKLVGLIDSYADIKVVEPVIGLLERIGQAIDGHAKVKAAVKPTSIAESKEAFVQREEKAAQKEEDARALSSMPFAGDAVALKKERRNLAKAFDAAQVERDKAFEARQHAALKVHQLKQEGANAEELAAAEKAFQEAEAKLRSADAQVNKAFAILEHKLATNPAFLGAEYANETEVTAGFRREEGGRAPEAPDREELKKALKGKSDQEQEALIDKFNLEVLRFRRANKKFQASNLTVTEYFNEEKREDSIVPGPDDGRSMSEKDPLSQVKRRPQGFVVDNDSQELHTFNPTDKQRVTDGADNPFTGTSDTQYQTTHHSSPTGGAPVAGAGQIYRDEYDDVTLSNASGHYKPSVAQLIQTLEILLRRGFLLDRDYVKYTPDHKGGEPLEGQALALHTAALRVEKRIAPDLKRCQELRRKIDAKQASGEDHAAEMAELEQLDAKLKPDLEMIAKSERMLGKLGAGPANKIQGNVAAVDAAPGSTGAQVRMAEGQARKKAVSVDEFLRSGGGTRVKNKSIVDVEPNLNAKKNVLDELKEKTAGRAEQLDQLADTRAKRIDWYVRNLDTTVLPKLRKKLAKLANQDGPEVEQQRAQLTKLVASYEQQQAARTPPSDEQMEEMARNLEANYYFGAVKSKVLPKLRKRLDQVANKEGPGVDKMRGELEAMIADYEKQIAERIQPSSKQVRTFEKILKGRKKGPWKKHDPKRLWQAREKAPAAVADAAATAPIDETADAAPVGVADGAADVPPISAANTPPVDTAEDAADAPPVDSPANDELLEEDGSHFYAPPSGDESEEEEDEGAEQYIENLSKYLADAGDDEEDEAEANDDEDFDWKYNG